MRATRVLSFFSVLLALPLGSGAQEVVEAPSVVLDGIPFAVSVTARVEPISVEVVDSRGAVLGTATRGVGRVEAS